MELIQLNSIELKLTQCENDVRVINEDFNVLLVNQTVSIIAELLKRNFKIVVEHYNAKGVEGLAGDYIDYISTKIVLGYLSMYNDWNNRYEKMKKRELLFDSKDFTSQGTYDDIMYYMRKWFEDKWVEKCAPLLDMTEEELNEYYTKRLDFYMK